MTPLLLPVRVAFRFFAASKATLLNRTWVDHEDPYLGVVVTRMGEGKVDIPLVKCGAAKASATPPRKDENLPEARDSFDVVPFESTGLRELLAVAHGFDFAGGKADADRGRPPLKSALGEIKSQLKRTSPRSGRAHTLDATPTPMRIHATGTGIYGITRFVLSHDAPLHAWRSSSFMVLTLQEFIRTQGYRWLASRIGAARMKANTSHIGRRRTRLASLAGALGLVLHAHAQEASPAPVESVVITATRSPVAASDAPASVTLLKREDIDNRNVSRITDALQAVPGLSTGRGENGQSNSFEGGFSLRGMETRRTLVLLDGLQPLQSGSSQGVNWLTVFVDDVERVEVVSGPFASLYGSNAMGGVINIISKKPTTAELTLHAKKGFNDVQGEDLSLYLRQPLGRGFGIAAGLSRARRYGYVSESTVRTPVTGAPGTAVNGAIATSTREGLAAYVVGDRGRQPWTQDNSTLKLSYELSPTARLHGGVAYANAEQGYTRYNTYLTDTATGAPVSSGTLGINGQRVTLSESNFVGSTPLEQGSTRWFVGYEATLWGDAALQADVSRIRRSFSFPTAGATSAWDGGPGSLTDTPDSSLDATVTLSAPLGAWHFLVVGLSLHADEAERRAYALTNWRDIKSRTSTSNGYDGRTRTVSAFAQDEFNVTPALTLYVGGRVDRWSTDGEYFQNTAPAARLVYPERSETAFNPKLSGVYKATRDLTLRASWGKAFRAPSNLDLYSTSIINSSVSPTGTLTTQSDPKLQPETASAWELGGEWHITRWAKANATFYQTRLRDLIYSQQIDLSLTQRINAGKARSQGLELGMAAKPLTWLEVASHVSWIDAKILDNRTDLPSQGQRMTNVPRRIAYLGLTATQGAWSTTVEARYNGKTFVTARNTDVVQGVPGSNDSIATVDAKLGYRFSPRWRLNLAANNLLDRKQYSFARLPRRNATLEAVASF